MTTVALDNKRFVFDSQITFGEERHFLLEGEDKAGIVELGDRKEWIIGVSGIASVDSIAEWLRGGTKIKELPEGDWEALMVDDTNQAYYSSNGTPNMIKVSKPFAIGSGAVYAMGALSCGVDARDAVLASKFLDIYTGGDIKFFELEDNSGRDTEPQVVPEDQYGKRIVETLEFNV